VRLPTTNRQRSPPGIDIRNHFALVWATTGVISVIAGVLWTFVAGGGFGVALIGLKVFPIVIIGGLDSVVGTIIAATSLPTAPLAPAHTPAVDPVFHLFPRPGIQRPQRLSPDLFRLAPYQLSRFAPRTRKSAAFPLQTGLRSPG